MDRTTWMLPTQAVMDREEGAEASLYEALHHLQDARCGQGKRPSAEPQNGFGIEAGCWSRVLA